MSIKDAWLAAPGDSMNESIKNIIREKWDDEPTAIQILEALDHCIYWGAASGFVVSGLNIMLEHAMKREGLTLDVLVEEAVWRN